MNTLRRILLTLMIAALPAFICGCEDHDNDNDANGKNSTTLEVNDNTPPTSVEPAYTIDELSGSWELDAESFTVSYVLGNFYGSKPPEFEWSLAVISPKDGSVAMTPHARPKGVLTGNRMDIPVTFVRYGTYYFSGTVIDQYHMRGTWRKDAGSGGWNDSAANGVWTAVKEEPLKESDKIEKLAGAWELDAETFSYSYIIDKFYDTNPVEFGIGLSTIKPKDGTVGMTPRHAPLGTLTGDQVEFDATFEDYGTYYFSGTFVDETHISGTWRKDASSGGWNDSATNGVWTAVKE